MTALDPESLDPGWRERVAGPPTVDPLRLCVMTTVALLGWLLGPWAVLVFAGLAGSAYVRARRGGLLRSKCLLRDTRLVVAWLGTLVVLALVVIGRDLAALLG